MQIVSSDESIELSFTDYSENAKVNNKKAENKQKEIPFFLYLKPEPALTKSCLIESLKKRKVSKIDFNEQKKDQLFYVTLVLMLICEAVFAVSGIVFFTDPVIQPVPLCHQNSTHTVGSPWVQNGSKVSFNISYPCYVHKSDEESYHEMPAHTITTISFLSLIILSGIPAVSNRIQKYRQNESVEVQNQELDFAIAKLSEDAENDDQELQVTTKDIKVIFPCLSKKELVMLDFLQLKKARKQWGKLFEERLQKSEFSKEQLAMWRLFYRLKWADSGKREQILTHAISQQIIGSNPDFFEMVARALQPLQANEVSHFCRILGRDILTKSAACTLSSKNVLPSIVMSISKENRLADLVQNSLGVRLDI